MLAFLVPAIARAHCPLCTAGAVAIGLGAYKLGISSLSVGIGIGAFAVALGLWVGRLIPRQYVPFQKELVVILSFASTILPVIPFMPSAFPVYLANWGEYGTTFAINRFLAGSAAGGILVALAPFISGALSGLFGKRRIPFQGMIVTTSLLIGAILVIEFAL